MVELFAIEDTGQNDELSMCKREGVSQMRVALFVGSAIGVSSLH